MVHLSMLVPSFCVASALLKTNLVPSLSTAEKDEEARKCADYLLCKTDGKKEEKGYGMYSCMVQ